MPSGLAIQIPCSPSKTAYGPAAFNPFGMAVWAGAGSAGAVSAAGIGVRVSVRPGEGEKPDVEGDAEVTALNVEPAGGFRPQEESQKIRQTRAITFRRMRILKRKNGADGCSTIGDYSIPVKPPHPALPPGIFRGSGSPLLLAGFWEGGADRG